MIPAANGHLVPGAEATEKSLHEARHKLKIKDMYRTPRNIITAIERTLNMRIGWDVCADHASNVAPTGSYFGLDKGQDSLKFWWYKRLPKMTVCFMNPPYSQIPAWVNKAKVEASRGLIVVGLLPDMRSSRWFQNHVEGKAPLCLLPDGRINFDPPSYALDPRDKDVYATDAGKVLGTVHPVNHTGQAFTVSKVVNRGMSGFGSGLAVARAEVPGERPFLSPTVADGRDTVERRAGKNGKWLKHSSNPWPSCVPVWTPWATGQTQYVRFERRPV